ncbi:hypothetical protein [Kineococcus indalonis]|uniref:hypothetical protein n=1 Tax=Kineococcus indalonis TaxID=2696566 RepID=UPI001412D8BC|nr:hypothetical protein [Kineococcus indalonis]NAZ85500.1 hypothetical protein [Kineococcus indalonis]
MIAAIFGLLGVLVGGLIQLASQWMAGYQKRSLDNTRIDLLQKMLNDDRHSWRKLETCSRVIGADRETTIELLIRAGARASEREGEENIWGLVSKHPFKQN